MQADGTALDVMIWKFANDKADVVEASASIWAALSGHPGDLLPEFSHMACLGWFFMSILSSSVGGDDVVAHAAYY